METMDQFDNYWAKGCEFCTCHYGQYIHIYENGYTRNMCSWCSEVRCDIPEDLVVFDCVNKKVETHVRVNPSTGH